LRIRFWRDIPGRNGDDFHRERPVGIANKSGSVPKGQRMLAPLADGTNLDYKRNRVTMTARRRLVHLALLITSALGTVGADVAVAQTTAQFPIQFDFLNPGARSLAMGSAFSGLADDASAAFTNPAGLLQLTRPEVSAEGRRRQLDTRFLAAGRINGNVLNIGEDRTRWVESSSLAIVMN
jgi:hypothetical protein